MSQAIKLKDFTVFFITYLVVSLIIYLTTSFSIPSWLITLFIVSPVYGICLIVMLWTTFKNRSAKVRYSKFLLVPIFVSQLVTVLASPASCYGWTGGRSCYSLIQDVLSPVSLRTSANNPHHWQLVESAFPIALVIYLISIVVFLVSIRIQSSRD